MRYSLLGPLGVAVLLWAGSSGAQSKAPDDDVVRPPPGTPGSTVDDTVRPPPGTPGSTASDPKRTPGTVKPPAKPVSTSEMPSAEESRKALAGTVKPPPKPEVDEYQAHASSQTFVRMFQRRYLVGTLSGDPETETLVPVYQYASLRVDDIDAPWQKDAIRMRISAWGVLDTMDVTQDQRLSGDLTAASVTANKGAAFVTLGRQVTVGGAARFTRFDGIATGFHLDSGFGADAYTGFSVIPRFRSRPEYVLLGSRADSNLRNPSALGSSSLTGYWLAGGRLSYSKETIGALGVSFHEERERGNLNRRWAAVDLNAQPTWNLIVGGFGALDMDAQHLAEARGFVDYRPRGPLSTTLEVMHNNPSLFLSRSSVLSVFSLNTFTEAGGEARIKLAQSLTLGGSAHHQWFSDSTAGNRLGGRIRAALGNNESLVTQLFYARVSESEIGYHSIRGTVSYFVAKPIVWTAELHQYWYDRAIREVSTSTYGSSTVEYAAPRKPWKVMLGAFAIRSPYANLDIQALARLTYETDLLSGGKKQ